jgi:hypothetical protein
MKASIRILWLSLILAGASCLALLSHAADSERPSLGGRVLPESSLRMTAGNVGGLPHTTAPMAAALPSAAGNELARTISQITGVAISPLLGTSAVGAWRYFQTPLDRRAQLPWFAQPWFWMPALALVAVAFAKDTMGPVTPSVLKKPLDVAEVLENKVSGLVAAGAFVPLAVGLFGALPGTEAGNLSAAGLAAATSSPWMNTLLAPFAVVAFVVVWLLGHVINVLILISPFTTLDTVLKLARTALLGTLVGASFVDERVGMVWAFVIILVGAVLAGWSFRLTVLGTVFVWDVLSRRRRWFKPDPKANWVFLARDVGETPLRTYGKLTRDEQQGLQLTYRPFLLGREQTVTLPAGEYCLGRGFIYSDLLKQEGDDTVRFGILPPRYKGHEEALSKTYAFGPPTDVGLRAVWRFLQELLGLGVRSEPVRSGARASG